MTSETPTDGRCNARTRDGGYCENYPVDGSSRCRMHGAAGGAPEGEANGNAKHLAYSEHFASDLTEREQAAHDDVVEALKEQDASQQLVRELASELFLKYKRSADPRFIAEARRLLSEFNVLENTDTVEVEGDLSLSSEEKERLGAVLERRPQS